MDFKKTRADRTQEVRRTNSRGPRCVGTGRVEMTDICHDVRTLSQALLLCERRFADALEAGDEGTAGRWAEVAHAVLAALRPQPTSST
jgi:hypothetical protein